MLSINCTRMRMSVKLQRVIYSKTADKLEICIFSSTLNCWLNVPEVKVQRLWHTAKSHKVQRMLN